MGEETKVTDQVVEMAAFFDQRCKEYDIVHPAMIGGGMESKNLIATYLKENTKRIVDFGCGTGLELNEIFKRFPQVYVTGIDLSRGMLNKLREKYPIQNIEIIQASYMDHDFGVHQFDAAVSVMTMHHFTHIEKISLYKKVLASLVDEGIYIECDYMIDTQEEEDYFTTEYEKIKRAQGIEGGYYHYDIPCTVSNQVLLLRKAGFTVVEKVWHNDKNVILIAKK